MKAALLWGALVLFACTHVASALPTDTWLVAVGNNTGARDEVSLLFAERDARELSDAFEMHAGLSSRKVVRLFSTSAQDVRRTLAEVNTEIRSRAGAGVPTALVVFYSGHADATALHLGNTELPLDEIQSLVAGSAAGVRLLIVDACRSGTVTRVKGVRAAESFRITMGEATTEGVAIITSSASGEQSQESDRLRGSFFTHHFVNALRGAADHDGDGRVTLSEAYGYTYSQTLRSSGDTIQLQHPTYSFDVKGRDELVLTTPADAQARAGRLQLGDAGIYLIMEDRQGGPVVAEVSPNAPNRELSLPPGNYFVQHRLATEYREYEVKLEQGRRITLASLQHKSVRYDRLVRARGGEASHVQGLTLLAEGHGAVIAGESTALGLRLGWGMDFGWGSLGLRLRGIAASGDGPDVVLPRTHSQIAAGVMVQRFIDFPVVSLAFGLLAEGVWHRQSFDTTREVPARSTFGGNFSGVLAAETHIGRGFALRFEGGPSTSVFEQVVVEHHAAAGTTLATPLTWFAAGGIVWRK